MKEVHKYRRPPLDLLESNNTLVNEYRQQCQSAFPELFDEKQSVSKTKNTLIIRCLAPNRVRVGRPPNSQNKAANDSGKDVPDSPSSSATAMPELTKALMARTNDAVTQSVIHAPKAQLPHNGKR
jgi:hypothetical protein